MLHMKKLFTLLVVCYTVTISAQSSYTPSQKNLDSRKTFQDNKYGMFIHWGLSSVLGNGEWVMNNRKIKIDDYKRYLRIFNPVDFDAEKWVLAVLVFVSTQSAALGIPHERTAMRIVTERSNSGEVSTRCLRQPTNASHPAIARASLFAAS